MGQLNSTIQERNIKIRLSDADVDSFCNRAAEVGLNISELLENFIIDLVGGDCSNGSDARKYVGAWYERCFGMLNNQNLLSFLAENESIENFLEIYKEMQIYSKSINGCERIDGNEMLRKYQALIRDIEEFYEWYVKDKTDASNFQEELKKLIAWDEQRMLMIGEK